MILVTFICLDTNHKIPWQILHSVHCCIAFSIKFLFPIWWLSSFLYYSVLFRVICYWCCFIDIECKKIKNIPRINGFNNRSWVNLYQLVRLGFEIKQADDKSPHLIWLGPSESLYLKKIQLRLVIIILPDIHDIFHEKICLLSWPGLGSMMFEIFDLLL